MADRESLDVNVLIVGGGPAGLAAALHLAHLMEGHNREVETGIRQGHKLSVGDICLLEKGREIGAHLLSGAVLDPKALEELLPDFGKQGSEFHNWSAIVSQDSVYFLTERSHWKLPLTPPFLNNHGNFVTSLNRLARWLGEKVEASGVNVFAGFAGKELLFENAAVIGVRTDDKGLDRRGRPKSNFQAGYDIHAKLTILCEGTRGSLTKQLIASKNLDHGRNPQVYALGIKELWELPAGRIEPGTVMHTAGWPLSSNEYGGGWIYGLPEGRVSIGLVSGLDYTDPRFDPHAAFQHFKTHPLLQKILEGGKRLKYGAKSIPEGGWFAVPKPVTDGAIIAGDSAGLLNSQRLKGIHLAIKSGMLAAETALEALRRDNFSEDQLADYVSRIENSWIKPELWKARNFRQAFDGGMVKGIFQVGLQTLTDGRGLRDRYQCRPGHERLRKFVGGSTPARKGSPSADGKLTFDKLTDVFYSGTKHDEDQPCHLLIESPDICNSRCVVEYGNPCQHFCPASVYEMVETKEGGQRLHLNPSNCVHCKTCDIMDPYQIITWVPPEGGGGPNYENL
ncbi:MAG: electron transfer flavoprotein-ubiquinone oxidoreductase [Acidobacteria bacterium]|nr:electron transfer flavoprotein-ubiquinone oxidoreductase [Acidobacteriota bacterium]